MNKYKIRPFVVKALVLLAYEDYNKDFSNEEILNKVIKETTVGKKLVIWEDPGSETYFEGLKLCYFKMSAHWRKRDFISMRRELNELKKEMRRTDIIKDDYDNNDKYSILNAMFTKMDAICDNNCMKWENAIDKYTVFLNMKGVSTMQQSTANNNLAIVYRYAMRPDCAIVHYENAKEKRSKIYDYESIRMSLVLTNYSVSLALCKEFENAHKYNDIALRVRKESYAQTHSDNARKIYHSSLMNNAYIYMCELIDKLDSDGECELSHRMKNRDSETNELMQKAEESLNVASDEENGLLYDCGSRADGEFINYYMICSEYLYFKAFDDITLLDKCNDLLKKTNDRFNKSGKSTFDELREALCNFYKGRVMYRYVISQNCENMLSESLRCILDASKKIDTLFYYDQDSEYHSYYLGVSYFMHAAIIQMVLDKGRTDLVDDIRDPKAEIEHYLTEAKKKMERCIEKSTGPSLRYVKYTHYNKRAFNRELMIIKNFKEFLNNSDEESVKRKENLFTGFYIDIPKN